LIRFNATSILRTAVIFNTFVAIFTLPAHFAETLTGLIAVSSCVTTAITANRLVAKMPCPITLTFACSWYISCFAGRCFDFFAFSIITTVERFADSTIGSGPTVVAGANVRLEAFSIGTTSAGRNVAISSLPKRVVIRISLAITLKRFVACAMLTIRKGYTFIAQMALPSYIASADVGPDALSMLARLVVVFANGNRAWIKGADQFLVIRFFPSG